MVIFCYFLGRSFIQLVNVQFKSMSNKQTLFHKVGDHVDYDAPRKCIGFFSVFQGLTFTLNVVNYFVRLSDNMFAFPLSAILIILIFEPPMRYIENLNHLEYVCQCCVCVCEQVCFAFLVFRCVLIIPSSQTPNCRWAFSQHVARC